MIVGEGMETQSEVISNNKEIKCFLLVKLWNLHMLEQNRVNDIIAILESQNGSQAYQFWL